MELVTGQMSNAAEKGDFHTQKALSQLNLNYFTHVLYNNADSSLTFFFFQIIEVALWSEAAFLPARFFMFQISQGMFSASQRYEISLI